MSRSPNRSQALAMKAAAAIAAQDDVDDAELQEADVVLDRPEPPAAAQSPPAAAPASAPAPKRGRGRPKSRRSVEARHTVYLDAPRQAALSRLAEDRGRSIHSLILEGIDYVIGKPQQPGWPAR